MSGLLDKTAGWLSRLGATAATALKIPIMSRRAGSPGRADGRRIIVLGNGPSLRQTIADHAPLLASTPAMAVNFAANTPEFTRLRPRLYILADGHFFDARSSDPNVERLWQSLSAADWPMRLYVPARRLEAARAWLGPDADIRAFNPTPAEGFAPWRRLIYRLRLGMPRPRNVMVPAIMTALDEGYREIWLAGADHSWLRSLWVDDRNRVVSVQPHFYADSDKERARVESEYAGYHLHDILHSMTVAFRSYVEIESYARSLGAEVINATPGSFIDAFTRRDLAELDGNFASQSPQKQ